MSNINKQLPAQFVPVVDKTNGTMNTNWYMFFRTFTSNSLINNGASGMLSSDGTLLYGRTLTAGSNKISITNASGISANPTFDVNQANLSIGSTQLTGTIQAAQFPALTGDITTSAGSLATTLANSGVTAGTYTYSTVTVDAKGRITSASSGLARKILTGSVTLYVNASTGSDSNDGTSGHPWRTLQHAHDYVRDNYDLAGFQVTFNCTGAFSAGMTEQGPLVGQISPSNQAWAFVSGATVSDTNAAMQSTNGVGFSIQSVSGTVTFSSSGGTGIAASTNSTIIINGGVAIGACGTSQIQTTWGGNVYMNNNITFSGNSQNSLYASGGVIQINNNVTVTYTGTPNYSNANVWAYATGVIGITGLTFSGAVTGVRYLSQACAFISTGTNGNVNYIPGNAAGSTSLGGQYF